MVHPAGRISPAGTSFIPRNEDDRIGSRKGIKEEGGTRSGMRKWFHFRLLLCVATMPLHSTIIELMFTFCQGLEGCNPGFSQSILTSGWNYGIAAGLGGGDASLRRFANRSQILVFLIFPTARVWQMASNLCRLTFQFPERTI